jgi:hypothetical protein
MQKGRHCIFIIILQHIPIHLKMQDNYRLSRGEDEESSGRLCYSLPVVDLSEKGSDCLANLCWGVLLNKVNTFDRYFLLVSPPSAEFSLWTHQY